MFIKVKVIQWWETVWLRRYIHVWNTAYIHVDSYVSIENKSDNLSVLFLDNSTCKYCLIFFQISNLKLNIITMIIINDNGKPSQIAKFMVPTWGPPGSCQPQMGPMLAPWTLLSGIAIIHEANLNLVSMMHRVSFVPLPNLFMEITHIVTHVCFTISSRNHATS